MCSEHRGDEADTENERGENKVAAQQRSGFRCMRESARDADRARDDVGRGCGLNASIRAQS